MLRTKEKVLKEGKIWKWRLPKKSKEERCYDLAIVKSDLDYLGVLLSFDGTLRDVHNVENQWLKQVSDLRGPE